MSRKEKPRLTFDRPPVINSPFADLKVEGLPAGDAVRAPAAPPARPANLGRVVLRRETAHRGGKVVVVVDDFAPHIGLAAIEELARKLRNACGCGGTVRERTIELQGEQAARARALLEAQGFKVAGVK